MSIKETELYLVEKRNEIIMALYKQKYSLAQIGRMFNMSKTAIHKIVNKTPPEWESPWVKKKPVKTKVIAK